MLAHRASEPDGCAPTRQVPAVCDDLKPRFDFWIRHPILVATLGLEVGLSLVSANGPLIAIVTVAAALLHGRIDKEEAMMVGKFGDEYLIYMRRMGLLLPRLRA